MRDAPAPGHPIAVAARRAGLSVDTVRAWERRHRAVAPRRTRGRRVYSDADIERLTLLGDATRGGRPIGLVARLPTPALRRLARTPSAGPGAGTDRGAASPIARSSGTTVAVPTPRPSARARTRGSESRALLDAALRAVRALDGGALEETLARATVALGVPAALEDLVAPLLCRVGDAWQRGTLRIAHEHLACAVVRSFLGTLAVPPAARDGAPVMVVATPAGQRHELGALCAAVLAGRAGLRAAFLGSDLPAEEIALAAERMSATAVVLGVTLLTDPRAIASELRRLRRLLPAPLPIHVGGAAASALGELLDELGMEPIADLAAFGRTLDALRR